MEASKTRRIPQKKFSTKLKPIPRSFLLDFHIDEVREKRHHELLKRSAKINQNKISKLKAPPDFLDLLPVPKLKMLASMQQYASNAPIPTMTKKTESKILRWVQPHYKRKYSNYIKEYINDLRTEYDEVVKEFSLHKMLHYNDDYSTKNPQFRFKFLGRTENYGQFKRNREKIKQKLFITYPFIRCILNYSQTDFPEILNDYSSYNFDSKGNSVYLTPNEFKARVAEDLVNKTLFLKNAWYPKIINVFKKNLRKYRLTPNVWYKIFDCAHGLINQQLNVIKIRTYQHIFDILLDRARTPRFQLQSECNGKDIDLCPQYNEINMLFTKIFEDISSVGSTLIPLDQIIKIGNEMPAAKSEYIPITIGESFMREMHEELDRSLLQAYTPILVYLTEFRSKYSDLYGDITQIEIAEFLSVPRDNYLDVYLDKIKVFQDFISKLRSQPVNEYFIIAILNQARAIAGLRCIATEFIDRITSKIVAEHTLECRNICKFFEDVESKSKEVPTTTEQLLEGGEFMTQVKTVHMKEMQIRIEENIRVRANTIINRFGDVLPTDLNHTLLNIQLMKTQVNGLLVDLTTLSQDHFDLQQRTINLFNDMYNVFEENAAFFEAYKVQFEEHLQSVTRKLNEDMENLVPSISIINEMSETEKLSEYHIILKNFIENLKCFDDYIVWINKEEKLFKLPVSKYEMLEQIKNFIFPFENLIRQCIRWLRYYYIWMDGPFEYLVPQFVESTVEDFLKEFLSIQKYYRNRIKQDMVGNPICKFKGQTEDPDPEKHPVPLKLCHKMIEWNKGFRLGVHIVNIMCNPALKPRHYDEMSEVVGFDITPDAGTTLRKMTKAGIEGKLDSLEIVSVGADKELQLQKSLVAMQSEWNTIDIPIGKYKDTEISILGNFDDIQAVLDDHIIKALTMRGSAFVKPCESEVRQWYDKLYRVNRTFEEWGKVQMSWLYLKPIFSSEDIVAQMPRENELYVQVDKIYRKYITNASQDPSLMKTAPVSGLLEEMESANVMLEEITNGVNQYLERKRLYFPRFFFLSNDEMLEILSETKNPLRVQPHLNKCFEGIYRLIFDAKLDISAMISSEKETINFVTKVSTSEARGSVEKWLLQVEEQMLAAVQNEITLSFDDYKTTARPKWIVKWPQMVVLCISQVYWALDVHDCLKGNDVLKEFFKKIQKDLTDIVALIRSKDLSNLNRNTIKSLIVIDVHAKDVVEDMVNKNVCSLDDFTWLAQLRYYYEDSSTFVRIINATVKFANEYLGNSERLVITPLTDRCYRTLVGAFQLHLNGAPEGPAGTGKTETTKDLAKALAVQCKVFNCSDGLDYIAMGKFFKGLASTGAWACFDEFNRIELEVLSVVAQQILCIMSAVKAGVEEFSFEGTTLCLNPSCYICITMNPGYAGRSELPDNLKVLFRTVAMMVPDYAMIGEISLYSYGFTAARSLAVKIVTTYRLCSEQLSTQNHYDYGMRAVKTVLVACGKNKADFPDEPEDSLLLRSIMDVNLPKFLSFDIPLFRGIISDLFPGVSLMKTDYTEMEKMFRETCKELNLQPVDCFFEKIVQTYEMMIVRHGFMMVGLPYAGKSTTLKVLSIILSKIKESTNSPYYQDCDIEILNPKAITMAQLYGAFDPLSLEWVDGVASTMFRNFVVDESPNRKWLIFDGPIDAVWIENMNTVLDDNKKLCLTSGEIITMNSKMSMIFEVMDLAQASPATVSRCGMIFMEPISLGWKVFARSWLNLCSPLWVADSDRIIMELFEWVIPPCISFIKRTCTQLIKPGEFNLLMTTFSMFQMLMDDAIEENADDYAKFLFNWYQAAIIMSVVWGLGGLLDINSRESFDAFYREIWSLNSPDYPPPPSCKAKLDITIPLEGLFCEYVYIFKQKGAWKYWPDLIRRNEPEVSALGIQVPTIDTGRYNYLLEMHTKHKKKMLLVGPTGTGKSFCTQNLLMNTLDAELYAPAFMTFTVSISATQTQDLLISKLQKFKRGKYGPPKGKICVIFVDDMNMPKKETYGAQPPIELLRQYFDHKYLFDKDTSKLNLYDLLIHVACGIPGGSRQDVYSRFTSHFNCFSINEFTADTMLRIFSNVLLMGLKKVGHAMDVIGTVTQIVNATLYVFNSSCVNLKPTPEKSHYIFNLRDIARVCAGCSMLRKESVDNKKIFTKLWLHETLRVFYDKLVNETDRKWLMQTIGDCIRDYFKDKLDNLFDVISSEATPAQVRDAANNLLFGTYLDLDSEPGDRKYEEISHLDKLSDIAYTNLEEYNATHKTKMDIVLFAYALRHLNKICRIMSLPAGSALLIGMGGSGRQTLTTLAAKICQQHLFQPVITKNYDVKEWRDDIKKVLKESGGYGKDTILLIAENQIKNPVFLTDIDCLLNLGEVPNIWPIDERQEILELVRLAAQGGNRNIDISPLQVFSYFVNRCKQKLHIVLCFSSIGSSLRNKIRMYPSLVNCCTVVWYETWPDDALQMVASKYMESINVEDNMKQSMVVLCQHFHVTAKEAYQKFYEETGRTVYLTSASFLGLIKSFISLINNKQTETMNAKMRYVCGLDTLQRAAEAVAIMQKDLNEFQPKLKQMAENSKVMTAEIEHNTIEASLATEQVKRDEVVANAQAAEAQSMEDECSKDLAQAVPVLEEAVQALNTLKNSDITLVKSMKNPPFAVKLVMAAVCVMKGVPPDRINDPATGKKVVDYWGPSKKILGDMAFLQSLKDYDKDDISPEIIAKIRKDFIPNKDFTPSVVAKASSAAEGLCKWIIALDLYEAVAKVVAPKKAKLNAAKQILTETKKILAEKRQLASELEANVTKLNQDLAAANAEKQRLEDEVELCTNKLRRAESLISGLGGERSRWTKAAEHLQSIYDSLPGDILISSGIIAYLAPVSLAIREICVTDWLSLCKKLKISCSDNYGLMAVLGLDHQIQNWHVAGLPRDLFSIENAIIMDNSNRYSLFIDPQDQANKWIKNMEKPNRLNIIKFTQSDYMKVIVNALEVGRPVLLEGIGNELEPPLDPLLSRNTFIYSGVEYISLNDNVIPISKNFRFYMTSNLRNPLFEPEAFTKVTIINFSLTQQGLNDQLLTTVVAKERPDLQQLLEEVIAENAKNKTKLKEVEDDILYTMSNSKKDILEDESSIKILDDSKVISADIIVKQITSQKTLAQIEEFRKNYKTFAAHSSMLYTSITDLPNIDPMYQFSLYWYINLYKYSIENAKRSVDQKQRISYLTEAITKNLYSAICRSIFEKDKLMYSFILCTKIMISDGRLPINLLMLLLTGGDAVDSSKSRPNPSPDWITDKIWDNILKLSNLENFNGFTDSFISNVSQWKAFYDSADPVSASIPAPWDKSLKFFEKLVILNTIRLDKTADGIKMFVSQEMGTEFVTPPQFDIGRSFQDATCLTPLIFVLSPGADPMGSLVIFAEKMGYIRTFQSISLGQGQGPIAQKLIEEAQDKGSWVCLQNCHLAVSWMPTLQMLWENMDFNNTTLSFRLWLTCYPTQNFPTPILQNGVKMTNEPPKGLQQNMLRTYMSEPLKDADFYNGCPGKDNAFARLLFGVSFFHAVVQERRKYGSIGWNIPYEFNDSDFQISVMQLQTFLNQYEKIPYAAICYLTGECNYGGRVTDVWDRRLIVDLLADYINADVVTNLTYEFAGEKKFVLWRKLEHPELVKYIDATIPNNPSPEVFGLHPNACITQELNTSQKLLDSMLMIQGKGSDTSAESSNSKLLAMVLDIIKRLPPNFDIELSEQKYPFNYNESMNTVLTQEMNRFNRLLSIIRKSCSDLEKSIKGILPITPELEILGSSLEFNKIPDVWLKASYPSIKPVASYIQDFLRRLQWLDDWYQNGKGTTFWLAGFYFTQAFLTGVVQNYARKYKIPIDTLTFDFNVLQSDRMDTNPAHGVYVNGIFIDGARWDKNRGVLAEQRPKVLIEGMPAMHLVPIKILNLPNDSRYKCPLYKTTDRRGILSTTGHSTNFVLQMLLKTNENASHWIKRSAALICQTND